MTEYRPRPIDTSNVALTPDLLALTERLAESTHDHWSLGRLEAGWIYGDRRDDDAKTHPGLVPYADLTEAEKQYDRTTALETLKAMVALGYRIERVVSSQ